MHTLIGREISHYRLLEPVGEGGMGCVWKAEDVTLGRLVAVKEIRNLTQDPEADVRFLREAQAVSRIDHPNVVTFYEMVETPEQQYLVMQYVDGSSVRNLLQQGPLDPALALDVACQVAAALEAAHAVSVVHRDIKPENIVWTQSGVAKVLDFGVAHFNDRSTITRSGSMVGTVPYMAPEQIQSQPVDGRTDIYSLGVLLFEMLTGRLPYSGRDVPALVYEILNAPPRNLSQVRPGLAPELSRIAAQAMAKRPEDRYSSASEILHDLKLARATLVQPVQRGFHFEQRLRRRALVSGVAILLGVAAVAVAWRPMLGLVRAGPPRMIVAPWENANRERLRSVDVERNHGRPHPRTRKPRRDARGEPRDARRDAGADRGDGRASKRCGNGTARRQPPRRAVPGSRNLRTLRWTLPHPLRSRRRTPWDVGTDLDARSQESGETNSIQHSTGLRTPLRQN